MTVKRSIYPGISAAEGDEEAQVELRTTGILSPMKADAISVIWRTASMIFTPPASDCRITGSNQSPARDGRMASFDPPTVFLSSFCNRVNLWRRAPWQDMENIGEW